MNSLHRLIVLVAAMLCLTAIIVTVLLVRDDDKPINPETGCPGAALIC